MGLFVSKLLDVFESFRDHPSKVLMVGLDAAGKTTILYRLKMKEVVTTLPTIGFNVETVSPCKGLTLTVWDLCGQKYTRCLWRYHFHDNDDSNDRERMQESQDELDTILEADELKDIPLLVLANKQDLPFAEPLPKIVEGLGLHKLNRQWHIQGFCAVNGDGILDGMQKFADMIKLFKKNQS